MSFHEHHYDNLLSTDRYREILSAILKDGVSTTKVFKTIINVQRNFQEKKINFERCLLLAWFLDETKTY